MVLPSITLAAALLAAGAHAEEGFVLEAPQYHPVAPLRLRAPLPPVEDPPLPRRVFVEVTDFDAKVHASPLRDTWGLGVVRRGTILEAQRKVSAEGCSPWAVLPSRGGVCDGDGVRFFDELSSPHDVTLSPDIAEDLPYRYAKVIESGTPRFARLPSADEIAALQTGEIPSTLPHEFTKGVVFIAIDRPFEVEEMVFVRTLEGDYIAREQLLPVAAPKTVGQHLIKTSLPVAFVINGDAPMFSHADDDVLTQEGIARRTARFAVIREVDIGDERFLEGAAGLLVRRTDTRLAEAIPRPSDAGSDEKWIHIDLDEQLLIAYEGDRPIFVTLISTGKEGYDTPTGHRRVRRKYISRRMMGPDPDTGTYDIAEVPWAMYYQGGYAMHGAYWHDEFGNVRSHGCTNIPPSAARWLFRWSSPEIPDRWHANFEAGTRVVLTRD